MDILTRFELRKIIRRKSFYAGILIMAVVVIVVTIAWVTSARITGKDGEDLKGLAAVSLRQEYDRGLAGSLTGVKLEDAVERHQQVMHDPNNLNEKGEIRDEPYAKYIVKDQQIANLIRTAFSPAGDYDYDIVDNMNPSDAEAFYEKRMEKINSFLTNDYSYGSRNFPYDNYSVEEKAFFNKMNESIPVPFQLDYVTGWENVFENLEFIFLISAFVIAIFLAPVFADEYQSGADSIILSTRYGRSKVIAAKLKASFIVSMGLLVFAVMIYTFLLLGIFGFDGGNASVQMIELMAPVPFTVFQTYLWAVLIGSLACLLVGAVTLWLSSRMRSPFPVIIASGIFLFGPLLVPATSRLLINIMNLLPGNMVRAFDRIIDYEVFHIFGQLIPGYKFMVGFAITVITVLLFFAYHRFKKHQVA